MEYVLTSLQSLVANGAASWTWSVAGYSITAGDVHRLLGWRPDNAEPNVAVSMSMQSPLIDPALGADSPIRAHDVAFACSMLAWCLSMSHSTITVVCPCSQASCKGVKPS